MNTFKQAAITILKKSKEPLHYREITRKALEEGLFETQGATPEATMNAQIVMDIKRYGDKSIFKRVSPAIFAINPEYKEPVQVKSASLLTQKDTYSVETGYIGKGGEFRVCSELLFRGFNASIMSVDTGIDIVAIKDNKRFEIQVKTANLNSYNTYVFDVRRTSFERFNSSNIFYVCVLRDESKTDFVIFPYLVLEQKLHEKAILEINKGNSYRLTLKFVADKLYLGRREHEVTYFLNNWKVIK